MDARSDPWIFRVVVACLGVTSIVAVAGVIALSATGHEQPQSLTTLGGTAIGALSGLLAALLGPQPLSIPTQHMLAEIHEATVNPEKKA